MVNITEKEFKEVINESSVLVDFWSPSCGPCVALLPVLAECEKEFTETKFAKVDASTNTGLLDKYGVYGIPTLILFKDGVEMKRSVGFRTSVQMKEFLKDG